MVAWDKDLTSQTDVISGNFHNFEGRDHVLGLDQKLAALFGTTIDKIVINDMAVHQPTQQIFLSVERGRGTDAIPAIVKVNHGNWRFWNWTRFPTPMSQSQTNRIPMPCWSLTLSRCMRLRILHTITASYL